MAITDKVWLATGCVMIFVSGACLIASLPTTYWMTVTEGEVDLNIGLFKSCQPDSCKDLDDLLIWTKESDAIQAVRAMVFLALIAWLAEVFLAMLYVLCGNRGVKNFKFFVVSLSASLACFIFAMIATAVFDLKVYSDLENELSYKSYSYYLCVAGGVFVQAGTDLALYGGRNM